MKLKLFIMAVVAAIGFSAISETASADWVMRTPVTRYCTPLGCSDWRQSGPSYYSQRNDYCLPSRLTEPHNSPMPQPSYSVPSRLTFPRYRILGE